MMRSHRINSGPHARHATPRHATPRHATHVRTGAQHCRCKYTQAEKQTDKHAQRQQQREQCSENLAHLPADRQLRRSWCDSATGACPPPTGVPNASRYNVRCYERSEYRGSSPEGARRSAVVCLKTRRAKQFDLDLARLAPPGQAAAQKRCQKSLARPWHCATGAATQAYAGLSVRVRSEPK